MQSNAMMSNRINVQSTPGLSDRAQKALRVHVGEKAGEEITEVISALVQRIDDLERSKVSITRIVPGSGSPTHDWVEEPV